MVHTVQYTHKIRLSDALYGAKFVLNRNNRNLQVTIPPRAKDGIKIKLTNALGITDGSPGDIIIQIQVAPRPVLNPAAGTNIDSIFQFRLYTIGGIDNAHVKNYLDSRNKAIYRQLFFEKAVGAIWVAGWGAKQCNTFLAKAPQYGFDWNFSSLALWSDSQLTQFMHRMHPKSVRGRARQKWEAVHKIAKWLNGFQNECDFRQRVFRNVLLGRNLDKQDVAALRDFKLSYIGEANAFYVVRMLGGEEIKDDRWIKEFREWANLSFYQLESLLDTYKIPRGFFDVVMWEYCNMFIGEVSKLKPHFQSQFGFLA